ncbi:hypothetical protein B0H19DRAFT_246779 [Mycena capillaripes]|nr:hypothetical protein B0H19DRAFT_246779 [Mycena capillaripes]
MNAVEWIVPELMSLKSTHQRLKISPQYQYMANRILALLSRRSHYFEEGCGGVVLTGNPGAGKSMFADYFFVRRIYEAKPVLYYKSKMLSVHLPEGCFLLRCSPPHRYGRRIPTALWPCESKHGGVPQSM